MKILGLSQLGSGCGFHRIVLPLGYMNGVKAHITNQPDANKLAEGWDILFYNRLSIFDEGWDEVRKQMNCKIVIDMDDDWTLPPNHLNFFAYEELKPRIENNIREADMVLCTNENLASRIYKFNQNVHIVPNALPYGNHQFQPDKREDERVRIFWAGGVTHECDIKILQNPVKRLNVFSDKIKMVIAGYNDTDPNTKRIWNNMFNDFTNSGKLPFTKLHSLDVHNYMQLYEWADIMLVPLENSWWHSCKSNLKLLEAATKAIPVICSYVQPYSNDLDAPVLWVKSQKDWFIHIKDLILNPNKRLDYGQALQEWANRKYNLFEVNKRRKELFEGLIKA